MLKFSVGAADQFTVKIGCRRGLTRAMAVLLASVAVGLPAAVVSAHAPEGPPRPGRVTSSALVIDGHGGGHGIGMSQWGAYGYAADRGWTAAQILDHYYGTTVAGTAGPGTVTVRLMRLDDQQTAVVHDRAQLVVDGVVGGPWGSVVAREVSPRSYTVWARADKVCPAAADTLATGWAVVASGLTSVLIRPQTDTSASNTFADLAAVCDPAGMVRSYRGSLRAVNGTDGLNRTVNEVPIEQYLRTIVASEMSASWATKGMEALQAQAIASRTYVLAEKRYSYAQTCDLVCQFYPGAATRATVSTAYNRVEQAATDRAVQATAGMVRRLGSVNGKLAYTMFSSSSGGWTASNGLGFPAVPDEGDATAGNPYHSWTETITGEAISAAWPSIGTFTGVVIVKRSGEGEWGGRVLTITVAGTSGQVTLTGDAFRRAVGMTSNWFNVREVVGSSPTPPVVPPSSGCAGRDAPAVSGAAAAGAASRFAAVAPQRLIDTRSGTGTQALALGAGCTLVVFPPVGVGSTAVSVDLVAVNPVATGFFTAYPCRSPRPGTSVLQSVPGRAVSGSAIVPLAADGSFCLFSSATTDVVIDLFGAFAPGVGSRYEPIASVRRFDSRPSGRRLAAGSIVRVATRGQGLAAADSTAASLSIHALDAAAGGFVTAWPCDTAMPVVSSLNISAGASVSNSADVAVGTTGEVCLFASAPMHLAVELNGWYGPSATTEFHSVTPYRLVDTRDNKGWNGAMPKSSSRSIAVSGTGGLPASGVRAIAAEITTVSASKAGFITAHPCAAQAPQLSTLRYGAGINAAVMVNGALSGAGRWCVLASAPTQLVVDVNGWFG